MTAPADRSRRTTSASWVAGVVLPSPPYVVTVPATAISSLIAIGTPCSGPSGFRAATTRSRCDASTLASSASRTVIALSAALSRS